MVYAWVRNYQSVVVVVVVFLLFFSMMQIRQVKCFLYMYFRRIFQILFRVANYHHHHHHYQVMFILF